MTIGLVTDSTSQLPADLAERFGVEVVPITIHVGEAEYLEGVDLSPEDFYAQLAELPAPVVSTSEPSPGQFALAYDALVERGCTQILSLHASSLVSGTLNAARLGSRCVPVPVRIVETSTTGFGLSCCVWSAATAIADGADLDAASAAADRVTSLITNVYVVGIGTVAGAGHADVGPIAATGDHGQVYRIPVLGFVDGSVQVIARVDTVVDAVNAMAEHIVQSGEHLNVGIGISDRTVAPLAAALRSAIGEAGNVLEVVDYRLGPSVGVHTGPGTVACLAFPAV